MNLTSYWMNMLLTFRPIARCKSNVQRAHLETDYKLQQQYTFNMTSYLLFLLTSLTIARCRSNSVHVGTYLGTHYEIKLKIVQDIWPSQASQAKLVKPVKPASQAKIAKPSQPAKFAQSCHQKIPVRVTLIGIHTLFLSYTSFLAR